MKFELWRVKSYLIDTQSVLSVSAESFKQAQTVHRVLACSRNPPLTTRHPSNLKRPPLNFKLHPSNFKLLTSNF